MCLIVSLPPCFHSISSYLSSISHFNSILSLVLCWLSFIVFKNLFPVFYRSIYVPSLPSIFAPFPLPSISIISLFHQFPSSHSILPPLYPYPLSYQCSYYDRVYVLRSYRGVQVNLFPKLAMLFVCKCSNLVSLWL